MGYSKAPNEDSRASLGRKDDDFYETSEQEDDPLRGPSSSSSRSSLFLHGFMRSGWASGYRNNKHRNFTSYLPWILNAFLSASVIYLLATSSRSVTPDSRLCVYSSEYPAERFTPAAEAIEHIPVVFQVAVGRDVSPYQGLPNDEKDALWQDLYDKGISIHIDDRINSQLYNKTEHVPIQGFERDHLGGIDVFHQLHCLNMIRMSYYPKRYNSSMINPDGTIDYMAWLHIDHCIESLRQSLTCHSDVAVNGFYWMEKVMSLEPEMHNVHMCRNFTKIREWTFSRYVDVLNNGTLRSRVEDGVVVDYTDIPEFDVNLAVPKDWNLTVDDL